MQFDPPKIKPLGESAVVVEFGNELSEDINTRAIALADSLHCSAFPGFIEAVPAYTTTTVFFDLAIVTRRTGSVSSVLPFVEEVIRDRIAHFPNEREAASDVVEIPADFSLASGLDLGSVAQRCRLSVSEVIEIFLSRTYRVFMIGFLPGFAYMGETDERIRVPRLAQPRASVPKGSIGLAGGQTGIYPLDSPGGWQIIGRTDVEMFDANADPPSRLRAGDLVRFIPI